MWVRILMIILAFVKWNFPFYLNNLGFFWLAFGLLFFCSV